MTNNQAKAFINYRNNMTAANAKALIAATPMTEATAEALNALPAIDRVAVAIAAQVKQFHSPTSDLYRNDILATILFANLSNLVNQADFPAA